MNALLKVGEAILVLVLLWLLACILMAIVAVAGVGIKAAFAAEGDIYVDVNMFAWHGQDYYYTEEKVYYKAHPSYVGTEQTVITAHEFNNEPVGVMVRLEMHENADVGVGVFKDSFNQTSVAVGIEYHTKRSRGVSAGVLIGLAPAYASAPVPQSPLVVLPMVQVNVPGTPTIGFRVGYMPFGDVPYGVFQLTAGF